MSYSVIFKIDNFIKFLIRSFLVDGCKLFQGNFGRSYNPIFFK